MNKKLLKIYKQHMSIDDIKLLAEYTTRYTSMERIAFKLSKYLPDTLPSVKGFGNLTSEILISAIREYDSKPGTHSDRYKAFLLNVTSTIREVLKFGVSNSSLKNIHGRGQYWDCLKESYEQWSEFYGVITPNIVVSDIDTSKQSYAIGVALSTFVFERSDWTFIGVPHIGVDEYFEDNLIDGMLGDDDIDNKIKLAL